MHGESRHQDALMGRYTHRQKRKEVSWPEIPQDFDGWAPKKEETYKARVILSLGCKEGTFVVFLMCLHGFLHNDRIYLL